MQDIHCDSCGELTPSYDIVNYGSMDRGYQQLCERCFNTEVANLAGLQDFEHVRFEPVGLTDSQGEAHTFHFRTSLFGTGLALDAFELRDAHPAGYQFQVIGDPADDRLALLGRLIAKMRRALSIRHLEHDEHGLRIADQTVRGRIEWDDAGAGQVPLLVIDGREVTWEELGRMLMSFEGWQVKLEIRDASEEI